MSELPALRPYQQRAISEARAACMRGARAPLIVSPTGSGKTVMGADIARGHLATGGAGVLWLAHRRELLDQAADALEWRTGLTVGVLAASEARRINPYAKIQVASVQTLRRRAELPQASLVVFDECVARGTLIDGRPIEAIQPGDLVSCFDRAVRRIVQRRVVRVFRNPSGPFLLRVHIAGRVITCTPNHPFFIRRDPNEGYLQAGALLPGDMCALRENVRGHETVGRTTSQDVRCFVPECASGVGARSHPQPGNAAQDLDVAANHGAPTARPRGEWYGAESVRSDLGTGNGTYAECGRIHGGGHTQVGIPKPLQDRPWRSGPTPRDRSGWGQPPFPRAEGAGREEGGVLDWARVDGIEVFERGRDSEFGALCPDDCVYNLEVEEHHNFFAEGVLVHNCHHMVSSDWIQLARAYEGAVRVGLSATPERGDGQGLGAIFDSIVVAATPAELTALGHLVPCHVIDPGRLLRSSEIAQRPVDAYLEHAVGRRTIVFAPHVKAARQYLEEFTAAGVRAALVHGELAAGERAETMARYRAGAIDVLLNVYVLTEGFDDPITSCAIIARGCGTAGMWLQMLGRVLRPAPGKVDALVLDLRGVVWVHGRPDEERSYSLDGKAIRRAGDVAEVRLCLVCGAPIPDGASACADCGRAPSELATPTALGLKLVPYAGKRLERDDQRVATLARWFRDARSKGFQLGWAYHKYKVVYGDWPPPDVKRAANDQLRRIA